MGWSNQALVAFEVITLGEIAGTWYRVELSDGGLAFSFGPTESGPFTEAGFLFQDRVFGFANALLTDMDLLLANFVGNADNVTAYLNPTGDLTGAGDHAKISLAASFFQNIVLAPGPWYLNNTVVFHENQYLTGSGFGSTIVNLVTTGIAAFQWTNANPAVYVPTASGGILEPGLTLVGPGGPAGVNPTDGSIGALMADIPKLRCKIQPVNCQWGLKSSNQNFFTEQAVFEVHSQSCTNPVVLECAASGGANRSGSFDRTEITVYHNDFLNGGYGLGGVQLLAGASIVGGKIKQYGNFNTPISGVGQSGVYALYLSGSTPAGVSPASHSSLGGTEVIHAVEFDGTSQAPSTIFVDAGGCDIDSCFGGLTYQRFAASSIAGSNTFQFTGPIFGDSTLLTALWSTEISSGFPAGWSGTINFRVAENGDQVSVSWSLGIASGTAVTFGEHIATVPAGFFFTGSAKKLAGTISEPAAADQWAGAVITPAGVFEYGGTGFTASGTQFWQGQETYPVVI